MILFILLALVIVLMITPPPGNEEQREINSNAAWSWHQRPLAIHFSGMYDKTYIASISNNGDINVQSVDHDTGEIKKSTIVRVSKSNIDDHNSPSVILRNSDHRLMVFWTYHPSDCIYYTISVNPEDVSLFEPVKKISTAGYLFTYTQPVELTSEGKIFLFTRSNKNPEKTNMWDVFISEDNGETWIHKDKPLWGDSSVSSPYTEITANGRDTIYFARSDWISGNPSYVRKNVFFMYYRNRTFYRADGSLIGSWDNLPLVNTTYLDLVYNSDIPGNSFAYAKDIAFDDRGYPVIVFSTMDQNLINYHWYARYNGTRWNVFFITDAGGNITESGSHPSYDGNIVLDHENVNDVYLGKEIRPGIFEIQKWSTPDNGISFQKISSVSDGQIHTKCIRPYVPINHSSSLPLLYLCGSYSMYDKFNTSLYGSFLYFPWKKAL